MDSGGVLVTGSLGLGVQLLANCWMLDLLSSGLLLGEVGRLIGRFLVGVSLMLEYAGF